MRRTALLTAAAATAASLLTATPSATAADSSVIFEYQSAWTTCLLGKPGLQVYANLTTQQPNVTVDVLMGTKVVRSATFAEAGWHAMEVPVTGHPIGATSLTNLRLLPRGWNTTSAVRVDGFQRRCDGWTSPQQYNAEPGGSIGYVQPTVTRTSAAGAKVYAAEGGELWVGSTGGHALDSGTLWHYQQLGADAPNAPLGLPTSSLWGIPGEWGPRHSESYITFQRGRIYERGRYGTHAMWGEIAKKWYALGYENSVLGFPFSSEVASPSGRGRMQYFGGGSILWSAATGAREVHGSIWALYDSMGADRSYLGLPKSDEYGISGGRRSDFQGGYITWTPAGGAVARRY
ncbi:hypothetical protein [Kineococcus glutinatus]|uniref:LGFP repeat-containing protein n=1 Tax=Kineococcus glutinatus TaxID=1070872 RepID=A0ABP9HK21_9ACTN